MIMKCSVAFVIIAAFSALQVVSSAKVVSDAAPKANANFLQHADVTDDDFAEPEGGRAPIVPQHVAKWSEKSEVPEFVQFILASSWVCMLGSLPFVLRLLDNKPITKTQIGVGVMMLIVLIGGFLLFTNIILFQSVHFDKIRPLTVVECIYFMSQVITTVGYGDITPAKIRGQVFVGLYVLGALFVISMLISDVAANAVAKAQEYRAKLLADSSADAAQEEDPGLRRGNTVLELITPEKPSFKPLLMALCVFGVLDICWIAFFSMHPGEGKTVFQAVYMSVITLSTVGFGYFTPVTEMGMIFGAFWMLFGSGALVNVISNFTVLMVKMNEFERFCPKESANEALALLNSVSDSNTEVTESEFLQFSLLQSKKVNKKEIETILQAFNSLKPIKGVAKVQAIEKSLQEEAPAN